MPTVEERVETLESLLGQFIVHTDIALRRLERQMEEAEKQRQTIREELRAYREEGERQRQALREELRAYREESERQRQALREELRAYRQETDRQIQAMRQEMKRMREEIREEMREEIKAVNKRWGELANKMGTLVEDIVVPNIRALAEEFFGCEEVEFFGVRIEKRHPETGQKREFDVIAVCPDRVVLNETKSTPRQNYIDDFVEFVREGRFFEYFPEHRGKALVPVFASLYMSEDVVRQLTRNRIYAMAMKEGTMEILNPDLKIQGGTSRASHKKRT